MIARSVRFPLQTGASAANRVLGSLFTGLPALGLVSLFGQMLLRGHGMNVVVLVPIAVVFGLVTVGILSFARQMSASDARLTPRGLSLEGGPASGLALAWSEIDPAYSKVDLIANPQRPSDPYPRTEFFLFPRTTEAVRIAVTYDPDERESFQALLECIRAGCSGEPPPPRRRETETLACPRCGAIAAPADATDVACRFCGARVVIGPEVRERIRALHDLASSPDAAMAERLLAQPGASRINKLLVVGAVALYGGGSLALLLGAEIGALVAGMVFFACVFAARALVADRGALRSLLLGFAAHAPSRPGEPETCRACRAPLPEGRPESLTLACPHCGATNLSGVDLRADAAVARSAQRDLSETLAHRARRRRAAWAWFFVSAGGLAAALVLARTYLARSF